MPIKGVISLPGDKSISHRMLMLAAMTRGENRIKNISSGLDVESTRHCLAVCGVHSTKSIQEVLIQGKPLSIPKSALDCGNSGTSVRLLTGLLAGQEISAKFIGDASLSSRPMSRIITPLEKMGASIESNDNCLPLKLSVESLKGIDYLTPVASAQIKSCILLAGLGTESSTKVTEPAKSRDHTEIALKFLGADVSTQDLTTEVSPLSHPLQSFEMTIPGDPSSAAFFIAAALIVPGSDLIIKNLLLNPTRIGFVKILQKMGAQITIIREWDECGERVGDIQVRYSLLNCITIGEDEIPSLIDELPVFALLATQADGITKVRGAKELRVKETDRIFAICSNLKNMNANIIEMKDGFIIEGPSQLQGCNIKTFHDHRIAMTFSVANLISNGNLLLDHPECVNISFPEFEQMFNSINK